MEREKHLPNEWRKKKKWKGLESENQERSELAPKKAKGKASVVTAKTRTVLVPVLGLPLPLLLTFQVNCRIVA